MPIRPTPTDFTPFGSMTIIQALRKIGEEVHFYNIDYFRPKEQEIIDYFSKNQFDIVGISAVVSTVYSYTKYLSNIIRNVLPDTIIVVGGNLAASAEILLRKCRVNFCVVGDGELIIQDLASAIKNKPLDYGRMKDILGICFLDENGQFHFTGYRKPLTADAVEFPDYSILEADRSISNYIQDEPPYAWCGPEIPSQMHGKKTALVRVAKGCVNRCTFCHRWEKGYRILPINKIIEHIQYLKSEYNVGFLDMCDESFGSNHKFTHELVAHLGKMGVIWRAGAVRAQAVDREMLMHWKANGCRQVIYGAESGSQTILDVMEKNTTVRMNIEALKWAHRAGLTTTVQIILGMPGETDKTIKETIDFLKECLPYYLTDFTKPTDKIHMNYAQALPGSPLYEYARQYGFIGKSIDQEEQYLLRISDTDAADITHFVNYTKQPLLKVLMWRYCISYEVDAHYTRHISGISFSFLQALKNLLSPDKYIRPVGLYLNPISRKWLYPLFAIPASIKSMKQANPSLSFFSLIVDYLRWNLTCLLRPVRGLSNKSIRKMVIIKPPLTQDEGSEMMIPLRLGR